MAGKAEGNYRMGFRIELNIREKKRKKTRKKHAKNTVFFESEEEKGAKVGKGEKGLFS